MFQLLNGLDNAIDVAETMTEIGRKAIGHLTWVVVFTVAFIALLAIAILTSHEPTQTDDAFQPSPIATAPKQAPKSKRKTTAKTKTLVPLS
jgi:hypothetical protein